MYHEEQEDPDLVRHQTFPSGEYNDEATIEADEDGIWISHVGVFIDWKWIDEARKKLEAIAAKPDP